MRFWSAIGLIEKNMAGIGAGLCILAVMLITVAGVFGRYVLHTDLIPGGYNLIERVLFPLIVFWAMPLAHREGLFPRFELLSEHLPRLAARALGAAVLAVEIAVYLAIARQRQPIQWDEEGRNHILRQRLGQIRT